MHEQLLLILGLLLLVMLLVMLAQRIKLPILSFWYLPDWGLALFPESLF